MYREDLRGMVDNGWHAAKPPYKGTWTALLHYDITRDGHVANVHVVQSSGVPAVDASAVSRVYEMQGQFRPLPSCYDKDTLDVDHTFKIIYR
jgi:TonB family protein